jgi:hypothetical protein
MSFILYFYYVRYLNIAQNKNLVFTSQKTALHDYEDQPVDVVQGRSCKVTVETLP